MSTETWQEKPAADVTGVHIASGWEKHLGSSQKDAFRSLVYKTEMKPSKGSN